MQSVADFEDGRSGSHSSFGRWVIPALILSVLLHVYFWYWASHVSLHHQSEEYYERTVPRTFHIERAEIDPKLLEPSQAEQKSVAQAPQPLNLPQEKIAFDLLMAETKGQVAAPKIEHPLLSDKPTAATTTLDKTILMAQQSGAQSALQDANSLQEALITDKPDGGGTRSMSDILQPDALPGRAVAPDGKLRGGSTPGFSNLDDLLAQTGPLSTETAPILMPTDLLFDYGRADLRPEALASLEKLGTLIQRNPSATFLIEGHTDSFGSTEFNQELSQQRAEGVKNWLISAMRIPDARIEARGLGSSRLLAPATGTIEEQQLNRRVEIVIRLPQSPSTPE